MRIIDFHYPVLGVLIALTACSGIDEPSAQPPETSSLRSELLRVADPWPGGNVPVCYYLPAGLSVSDRQSRLDFLTRSRRAVEDNWQRVANINFFAWGPCGADTKGWLTIRLERGTGSFSSVGYPGSGGTANMTLDVNDTREPVVALHEFGHALGFSHEFDAHDWSGTCMACASNADCGSSDGKVCLPSGYCGHTHGIYDAVTPADRDSIMAATYCGGWAETHGSLSSWDVIGVQRVYGRKHHGSIVGLGGRCMNVSGGTTAWGKDLIAWPCVSANNDTFYSVPTSTGAPLFRANISGADLCVNVSGGVVSSGSSTPLISWGCGGAPDNEQFSSFGVQLRAMGNMCVSATDTTAGAQLNVQDCGVVSARRSRWDLLGSTIRLSGTNLCVTVPAPPNSLGTRPELQPCGLGASRQAYSFTYGEIGKGSLCFNVLGGLPTVGSGVGLWDGCGLGLDNEYFYTTGALRSLGQCVDMLGGVSYQGAPIGMYSCLDNHPNQVWDYHWR